MADFERNVRDKLSKNGYVFERHGKGDHDIWKNASTGKRVTVDGTIKSRHTANAVMKQAGIDFKF